MDCKKIKLLLPDFINNELSKELEIEVKNHIDKCKNCMQELIFLKSYFNRVKKIKKIEAPDDLLDKIHSRLKEKFIFKNLLNKLFIPFHIKIPIAVTSAVIFIILLLNPIKQLFIHETKIVEKPKEEIITKGETAPQKNEEDQSLAMAKEDKGKKEIKSSKDAESPKTEVEKLYKISLIIVPKESENLSLIKRGIDKREEKSTSDEKVKEPTSDINTFLKDKFNQIIEVIKSLDGQIISPEDYGQSTSLNLMLIDIPERNYKIFIEKLNKIGITTIKENKDKEDLINSFEIELIFDK